MTPQEAVLRMRSLADENGVTSAFYDDALDLYKYADQGEKEICNVLIRVFREQRKKDPGYENPSLSPLITPSTINTTAGTIEYSQPGDYMEWYSMKYSPNGGGIFLNATLLPYEEIMQRQGNSLMAGDPTLGQVYAYVAGGKIGVDPAPPASVTGGILLRYLAKPAVVTSSSTGFTLIGNVHELIPVYGLAMMLIKDSKYEQATGFLKQFYDGIPV